MRPRRNVGCKKRFIALSTNYVSPVSFRIIATTDDTLFPKLSESQLSSLCAYHIFFYFFFHQKFSISGIHVFLDSRLIIIKKSLD